MLKSRSTMDPRLIRRPIIDLLCRRSQCLAINGLAIRRHESSYRRTKKKLNIKPDASFLFSGSSPQQDHIIFNPPSSAPSVFQTPLKFLPKDDKRRQLLATSTTSTATSDARLPPEIFKPKPWFQRHHLSEEDIAEIRRLRTADPDTWTRHKLAKKFNCSSMFVGMVCEAPPARLEKAKAKLDAVKSRWGTKRTMAREDRVKRLEAVWRDE